MKNLYEHLIKKHIERTTEKFGVGSMCILLDVAQTKMWAFVGKILSSKKSNNNYILSIEFLYDNEGRTYSMDNGYVDEGHTFKLDSYGILYLDDDFPDSESHVIYCIEESDCKEIIELIYNNERKTQKQKHMFTELIRRDFEIHNGCYDKFIKLLNK